MAMDGTGWGAAGAGLGAISDAIFRNYELNEGKRRQVEQERLRQEAMKNEIAQTAIQRSLADLRGQEFGLDKDRFAEQTRQFNVADQFNREGRLADAVRLAGPNADVGTAAGALPLPIRDALLDRATGKTRVPGLTPELENARMHARAALTSAGAVAQNARTNESYRQAQESRELMEGGMGALNRLFQTIQGQPLGTLEELDKNAITAERGRRMQQFGANPLTQQAIQQYNLGAKRMGLPELTLEQFLALQQGAASAGPASPAAPSPSPTRPPVGW